MDRARREKLAPWAALALIFVIFGCLVLYSRVSEQFLQEQEKISVLAAQYPGAEGMVVSARQGKYSVSEQENTEDREKRREKYQYGALDFQSCRNILLSGSLFMGLGILCIFILYLLLEKKQKKQQEEIHNIEERLLILSRGAYAPRGQEENEVSPAFERIDELIRQSEFRFRQISQRAEMEEQDTKELITNISHQLKTPLASMKLSYEMMEYEKLTEAERKQFADKGKAEIQKLDDLFQVLLNLSRLEKHMIQLKPRNSGIKACVLDAVDSVYMKAHKKGIAVALSTEQDIRCFYDKRWTTEAIVNILDNAVKYSRSGTEIVIRILPMPHYALLEIEDQGMGMKKEDYYKVFQRFYRGVCASETETEGAGVGLYLARMVVEQQKGMIAVKSKIGQGSTFSIMLPRKS